MSTDSGPTAPRGRRRARPLIVATLIVAASIVLSGCAGLFGHVACGCASTASPFNGASPTAWPVSASQAAATAQKFAGVVMRADQWEPSAGPLYELTDGNSYASVDGETGRLLQSFRLDRMPKNDAGTVAAADGLTAASAYLDNAGVSTIGLTTSVQSQTLKSVAYLEVTWQDPDGTARLEVLVNASTDTVFGFEDLGFGPKFSLAVPIVEQTGAMGLAQSSTFAAGAQAMSTDFEVTPGGSGEPAFQWLVVFNDGVLSVDAATGEVASLKWQS